MQPLPDGYTHKAFLNAPPPIPQKNYFLEALAASQPQRSKRIPKWRAAQLRGAYQQVTKPSNARAMRLKAKYQRVMQGGR